jgi:uncharacterized OB-fold protein
VSAAQPAVAVSGAVLVSDDSSPLDLSTGAPRLIGGRCGQCGRAIFPHRERCPGCAQGDVESIALPSVGTLWSYTVQGFQPPSPPFGGGDPDQFEPFAVGYVELPGWLRVETRLLADPRELRIGMPLRLVPLELDGEQLFAFAPISEEAGA